MPRLDYKNCKGCGRHVDEVGVLSHTRLCSTCATQRLRAAVEEQRRHSGPVFNYWRSRIAASVGAILVDDREVP